MIQNFVLDVNENGMPFYRMKKTPIFLIGVEFFYISLVQILDFLYNTR